MDKLTLQNFDEKTKNIKKNNLDFIKVGYSTCGIAAGADVVYEILKKEVEDKKINISVTKCGCAGMCYAEPLVEVSVEGMPKVMYSKVDKQIALKIFRKHVLEKKILNNNVFSIRG